MFTEKIIIPIEKLTIDQYEIIKDYFVYYLSNVQQDMIKKDREMRDRVYAEIKANNIKDVNVINSIRREMAEWEDAHIPYTGKGVIDAGEWTITETDKTVICTPRTNGTDFNMKALLHHIGVNI